MNRPSIPDSVARRHTSRQCRITSTTIAEYPRRAQPRHKRRTCFGIVRDPERRHQRVITIGVEVS